MCIRDSAALTEDGACSHCFGIVPPQLQNEVRHGESLIRCEGCGVILTLTEYEDELTGVMATEESVEEEAAEEPVEEEAAVSQEVSGETVDEDQVDE